MNEFAERFLHIDMDAFFVEVERLRAPELNGRPVVVGGTGRRGVVASASYEARRRGVRSAMPTVEARRRCPHAVFVPPDHRRYREVSAQVFAVLEGFTPFVETLSIDEAFLDIRGLRHHYATPRAVGGAIREEVRSVVGLPASVGIATVKFLAKLASEEAKPDGMFVISAGEELTFLDPLPLDRLWGVGAATGAALRGLGVATVGELRDVPPRLLSRQVGAGAAAHLAALAAGNDSREIVIDDAARSVSVEETYAADLGDRESVERELLRLCDRLSGRLHGSRLRGRTVTLKVRFADFTTVTRSVTRSEPIGLRPELWDEARVLLDRARLSGRPVRLLGVGVSHLSTAEPALQLRLEDGARQAAADVAETIRERYGTEAVIPARLAAEFEPSPAIGETSAPDGPQAEDPRADGVE